MLLKVLNTPMPLSCIMLFPGHPSQNLCRLESVISAKKNTILSGCINPEYRHFLIQLLSSKKCMGKDGPQFVMKLSSNCLVKCIFHLILTVLIHVFVLIQEHRFQAASISRKHF